MDKTTPQRMSILTLSPQFRPILGGYERAAERLSGALAKLGVDVTVITERRESFWPAHESADGVAIHRLPCIYRPHIHMLSSLLAFAWFLLWRGRRFDVWHVHQYGLHALLAVALGKALRRPVVVKLTSAGEQGIGKTVSHLPLPRLSAALLRRMAACVATSRTTLEEALAFGIPPERVHLVGNGVDTRLFHPAPSPERLAERESLGINASGLIIFVGRLSPEKNPDGLLTAWQSAQKELPDGWRLMLLGDGPMRDTLNSAIESSGQGEYVRLAGNQKDVARWMRAADVYVLTSHHEGLSNTTLEAMASGLPVITTRVSGSAETVGETGAGIVVDVGRMDQLQAALIRLVRDAPLQEQMGRIGRAVVAEQYSIEHVAEAHLGLYQRLVAGAQKGRCNS